MSEKHPIKIRVDQELLKELEEVYSQESKTEIITSALQEFIDENKEK